jgi:hypothetical protein
VSENERLHPFLLGVAPAVIGLIAAFTVTILETSVTDAYTTLIALGAFAALSRWHSKLTAVYGWASPESSALSFGTRWSKRCRLATARRCGQRAALAAQTEPNRA